jgi:TRAP-type uncharacterized transport system substrate-binding protein
MKGTGSYEELQIIFGPNVLDIWDTIDEKTFQLDHCADALKLREVDAIWAYSSGGQIVGYGEQTILRTDSVLLPPTPEELEKIVKFSEFFFPKEISPGYYGKDLGPTISFQAPAIGFVYIVDPDVPEEIVYKAVKTAFEHAGEMSKSVAIWKSFAQNPLEYNLPYLIEYKKLGVPIHPGVLRYLRELGCDTKTLGLE